MKSTHKRKPRNPPRKRRGNPRGNPGHWGAERCSGCKTVLQVVELEVGSGYCHACGHAALGAQLVRLRTIATDLAHRAGFATLTAAVVWYDQLQILQAKKDEDQWRATESRSGGNGNDSTG